jgi:hypothetical protein
MHRRARVSTAALARARRLVVKSMEGEQLDDHAKTLMGWLEEGVFDALQEGYLDKARRRRPSPTGRVALFSLHCVRVLQVTLVMAADEAGDEVLEAWDLSVAWAEAADGTEHAVLRTGGPRRARELAVKPPTAKPGRKPRYTQARCTAQHAAGHTATRALPRSVRG